MTSVSINPATPADEDALVAIATSSGLFADDEAPMFREMASSTLGGGDASAWLVAAYHDEIIGGAYVAPDGLSEDVWNLLFIAVAPGAQRRGAGGALLTAVEGLARAAGVRILLIETSSAPDQAAARAFYDGRGYQRQGCIADYYQPGEDKIIFARSLTDAPAKS